MTTDYQVVIGIEVHAQLKTKSKLFCACSTDFGQIPNTNTCPTCLGLPGALPVLNETAVDMAITAGFALNCDIQPLSVFSRKNYFYPDLPKGYQISQFDLPICGKGHLDIDINGTKKRIGITRIHMEEDAGKLLHQGSDSIAGADYSLVDLNRASVPLIEIVSEPDIRSAEEARVYMETIKLIVQQMGVCDGNLEEGSLRADANISLMPKGSSVFGTRTEIKNINSFRSIERAIKSEIVRQTEILNDGGTIIQQTRNYDDATQTTSALRDKANAHDYRYFPDPDLLPLKLTPEHIAKIKAALPEHPLVKLDRYQKEYNLSEKESRIIVDDASLTIYFEQCLLHTKKLSPKEICNWILSDLSALLNESEQNFSSTKVTPQHLISLIDLIKSGKISGKIAKDVLQTCFKTGAHPEKIISESGQTQISDTSELDSLVDNILAANQDVVEKVKAGKTKSADFLMGQVMKATRGRAKPDLVKTIILDKILG